MKSINIQAAKTHLSRLIEEACRGEEILIAKAGKPMVRLVAFSPNQQPRQPGGWKGKVTVSADFDAEDPAIHALFHGNPIAPGA